MPKRELVTLLGVALTPLARNVRAVDEHEQIVSALRGRGLMAVQHLRRRAHLPRFYENVASLPIADRPADT